MALQGIGNSQQQSSIPAEQLLTVIASALQQGGELGQPQNGGSAALPIGENNQAQGEQTGNHGPSCADCPACTL